MKPSVDIQGGNPLKGSIKISGSHIAASKIIYASLFVSEDVVLENVPNVDTVKSDLSLIKALGASYEWIGKNSLLINAANLTSFEVPFEIGSQLRTTMLVVGPLLHKFGKACVPLPLNIKAGFRPINRWFDVWDAFGVKIREKDGIVTFDSSEVRAADIKFKGITNSGTDNAILTASFINGESTISNASQSPETDNLIDFVNSIGAKVERVEPDVIKVTGTSTFSSAKHRIIFDKNEAVLFMLLALITNGNLILKGTERGPLLSFLSSLPKIGATFEFANDEIRIWRIGEELQPINITSAPSPAYLTDWISPMCALMTQVEGTSVFHDTVYVDNFGYVTQLNSMGANIELKRPSEVGLECVISNDAYNLKVEGEPFTVAHVTGKTKLKGRSLHIEGYNSGLALVSAALCAEGKSTVIGIEKVEQYTEDFIEKLLSLGASIER
ncbi:UDP-N-acetylglucosamine 1-carboxyvinyltransferase [Candidatus Nomurabacteria bacterium]|uniref:UDP-N-acetylglucosamine 1-carboxyvinyltransferase n=1 Tax=candidate division WWE3 bacterium TaxID=2053526 RepID=A0A955IVS0_UNCKA|nr:UDP-N-acetylglucosamine 1-carboxyvinyltransferase [candidate division WWE3 bacterium]MCB9824099.1 UDP-N-acetylglucosamine 1-carboxyvinyltransferase [Candidatus Nomurabacteria bacterium]MCB9826930.1 UDP-N-acetylglucosamine 1-carboxyvinyltransferase [Candidatus Nomurabacteria bacterium]MCB9828040.1 UDP-N-acetylglucosamine 1-carboxyvinyltransferase [Candidatus Nomurabacteria bacterium]HXK52899.1 UDP-N-acetylglucosamine 1-carboxyvinyltransferase [bacterium]